LKKQGPTLPWPSADAYKKRLMQEAQMKKKYVKKY
jgi:hypothetical protein